MTFLFYLDILIEGGSLKKYNAVNNKWLLFGLVIPILLFLLSYNAVFAYFTASASEKQASTQTAIVRIGFKEDANGDKATHEIISNSATSTVKTVLPGDTINAKATIENTGNVPIYCIINFKLNIETSEGLTEEISNDFYTFTSTGTLTKIALSDTYTESACLIAANGTVNLTVPTEFLGASYNNDYKNALVTYTFTGYAIQTSGLTPTTAIAELVTGLLKGGNRITKITGNSVQNGTPSPDSPVDIQSVGEKTKNLFNINVEKTESAGEFSNTSIRLLQEGVWYPGITHNNYNNPSHLLSYTINDGSLTILSRYSYGLGQAFNCLPNEEYSLTYVKDKDIAASRLSVGFYKENGEFISYNTNPSNFTTPEDCYLFTICIYSADNIETTFSNIQLEKGSSATEYEPYGYKIPLKTTGKNLFNDEVTTTKVGASYLGFSMEDYNKDDYTLQIKLKENKTVPTNAYFGFIYDNSNAAWLINNGSLYPAYKGLVSLDLNSIAVNGVGCYPATQEVWNSVVDAFEIVLYKGKYTLSTIPEYEPYKETITNIYLDEPLRKVGNYADYIDVENGKVVRNVFSEKFNLENANIYKTGDKWQKEDCTSVYVNNILLHAGINASVANAQISNMFLSGSWGWGNKNAPYNYVLAGHDNKHLYMIIENKYLTNITNESSDDERINAIKNYFSNNNLEIAYVLATPMEEDIELPEVLHDVITNYEFLTTIQPDTTIEFTIKE